MKKPTKYNININSIITSIFFAALMIIFQKNLLANDNKSQSAVWENNFETAKQLAKEQNKNILLYFSGSDWCIPCMQLKKEVFEQDSIMIFIDKNFIAIALDFPAHTENQLSEDQQEHNEKMAEIYNKNGSFPLIIVLDSDGIEIGTIKGYLREGSDKFLNKLTSIIEK